MQSRSVLIRAALMLAAAFALVPLLNGGPAPSGAFADDKPVGGIGSFQSGNSFGARNTAELREKAVMAGGGNAASEAAVATGLKWLALHQAPDGSWSLDRIHAFAHEKVGDARRFTCNCGGAGQHNDTAGTAFGLLPFLGAGITHKSDAGWKEDYRKTVDAGLKWLVKHQDKDGNLGGGMYAHGLATIALCEAYGVSGDFAMKAPAQKAMDYIVAAQDPAKGGWRYTPRGGSDTSVTGWQLMALKSGQLAGLKVPAPTLAGAEKWLDSCEGGKVGTKTFGYGYTDRSVTPTMTATALLCRQYLGWSPKKPQLITGVANLSFHRPGTNGEVNSMYFNYYATQVMHHMGGDSWKEWNTKMRDKLVKGQDQGKTDKHAHQAGSWGPEGDVFGGQGGRVMQTSLSLLTLEVYYRHAPLFRRDKE